jgi:hypothetical protein
MNEDEMKNNVYQNIAKVVNKIMQSLRSLSLGLLILTISASCKSITFYKLYFICVNEQNKLFDQCQIFSRQKNRIHKTIAIQER